MIKLIASAFVMTICCTGALAYEESAELNAALASKQKVSNFIFDEKLKSFSIIPGMNKTSIIIIYVKKYRPSNNGAVPADPVRVNCDGVLTIVNPGSSFACYTPENKTSKVEIEPGFFKNGTEGLVLSAE